MRITTFLYFSALSIASGGYGWAQDEAQAPALTLVEPWYETYSDRAEISGKLVAGLVIRGEEVPPSSGQTAAAFIPSVWSGQQVCFEVTSQDGRYEGQWPFKVVSTLSEDRGVQVPFLTEYGEDLAAFDAGLIGAVMRLGECNALSYVVAPVLWGGEAAPETVRDETSVLELRLNTHRADEVYLYHEDINVSAAEIACSPVAADRRISFDTVCELPWSFLPVAQNVLSVETVKSGRLQTPEEITIVVPGVGG